MKVATLKRRLNLIPCPIWVIQNLSVSICSVGISQASLVERQPRNEARARCLVGRFSRVVRTNEDESLGAAHWFGDRDDHDRESAVFLGPLCEADHGRDALEIVRRAIGFHTVYLF